MAYRPIREISSALMSAGTDSGFRIRSPVNSLTQAAQRQVSRRYLFVTTLLCPSAQEMWTSRFSTRRISTGVVFTCDSESPQGDVDPWRGRAKDLGRPPRDAAGARRAGA